ncbi:MAG: Na+/H+ antiporter NhaA [SAR202 cluster bacterium]|nr:Na+/H+ antiporter NhaA [SAR202 cluster bacterium]MDP6514813.1 Na+/H+ antiporter NhaA [SAR202 cluster bacterium]
MKFIKFLDSEPEQPRINHVVRPFQRFTAQEASAGIVLLACAIAALIWANSPWSHNYYELWETHIKIGFADYAMDEPLHFWINDALMAVFFFVVGLEIKREVLVGELASPRQAALPIMAAVGGMAIPAVVYMALNAGGPGSTGWGIPMATDIAFSLGVLALLGSRIPITLKVFLTAFAIVDDIGAVAVIAVFYTDEVVWANVGAAVGLLGVLAAINWLGVRHAMVYAILGAGVWFSFLTSGIHATVAGILIAATIPSTVRINPREFIEHGRAMLDQFEQGVERNDPEHTTIGQRAAVEELERACMDVESPLQQLEHDMHPWVAFGVMPLFALANAGVALDAGLLNDLSGRVSLGVLAGLIIGKQVGIFTFAWLAIRIGFASMPQSVSWRQIYGLSWLGGIGFTMSIFITGLALEGEQLVSESKLAILVASLICGAIGWWILRIPNRPTRHTGIE